MAATARDPRVLRALELLRSPTDRVALDHPELVRAALAEGLVVEEAIAADPGAWPELSAAAGDPDAMRALGALGQPAEVVAIVRLPGPPFAVAAGSLVLAGVSDGGNVGDVCRSAAAFGATVALTPGTASPFSRKALRASRGAALRPGLVSPILSLDDIDVPLAAAVPRGRVSPDEIPSTHAVLLGNEHTGLTADQLARCDLSVTVPAPGFESLNVAAAAAVLLYAMMRA